MASTSLAKREVVLRSGLGVRPYGASKCIKKNPPSQLGRTSASCDWLMMMMRIASLHSRIEMGKCKRPERKRVSAIVVDEVTQMNTYPTATFILPQKLPLPESSTYYKSSVDASAFLSLLSISLTPQALVFAHCARFFCSFG